MINVALISGWHVHAQDYAKQIQSNESLSIKLVWDEDEERGRKWANELNVPFEANLQRVLENQSINAVVVNAPTSMHKKIIIEAAKNKKHIFTEKILAFTLEDCLEIYDAVEQNNVELMVSLPRLTEDYYLYAQKALDYGWLGELTTIRSRLAHDGAVADQGKSEGWLPRHFFNKDQTGGGALIDLGAHPIYLTNRLAGKVESLCATLQQTHNLEVDDNAVVLLKYESGAVGIIETGFLSKGSPFQLELYGTKGTLLIEDAQIRIKSLQFETNEWITPKDIPEAQSMPIEQWVAAIHGKADPTIKKADVINLTLINQLAERSHAEGKWIRTSDIKTTLTSELY